MKNLLLFIALCFTILISYKKKENEFDFSISNISINDSGVLIEWNKVDVSNFKHYEVLRSIDGKRFETINNIYSLNSQAYDVDITSYIDLSYRTFGYLLINTK